MRQPQPALWFSRHVPTIEQLREIESSGHFLTEEVIRKGMELGSLEYDPETLKGNAIYALAALAKSESAHTIYGVFPTHILSWAFGCAQTSIQRGDWRTPITLFAAINTRRTVEGGKPTFQHHSFSAVGALDLKDFTAEELEPGF